MSSRASSVPCDDNDDDFGDVFTAMDSSSPVHAPKHARDEDAEDEIDLPPNVETVTANGNTVGSGAPNPNVVQAMKRLAARKKLRTEQQDELKSFLQDTVTVRECKLFIAVMANHNAIDKIVVSQPSFKVSDELEKNINIYAVAILLSSKISSYKGNTATKHLMDIIKKYHFDLPPNIKCFPAAMGRVKACAQKALTQKRSKFKKLLAASVHETVRKGKLRRLPDNKCQHIFDLARSFVEGTECTISIPLCCRIAVMRKVYVKNMGSNLWDRLDASLASIHDKAAGNPKQLVKAFKFILESDQKTYGQADAEGNDGQDVLEDVDTFQEGVDNFIRAATMSAASSAQPDEESSEGTAGAATSGATLPS
ncbi:hypothetical protein CPB85DRAFT_1439783 [Mucidula mucida]|nr:hypothetical protein CPB85DRAFT_1439783 [Mucidula mucida]